MVTLLLTEQLTVLFLMMGCGFVLVKTKIVKSRDSKTLSLISVYLIMPCVIINAFQIDYSKEIQDGFLLALFAAVILHLLFQLRLYAGFHPLTTPYPLPVFPPDTNCS